MKRTVIAGLALLSVACGDMTRQGTSSAYLQITQLDAASGAEPEAFDGVLASDVITVTDQDTGATILENEHSITVSRDGFSWTAVRDALEALPRERPDRQRAAPA